MIHDPKLRAKNVIRYTFCRNGYSINRTFANLQTRVERMNRSLYFPFGLRVGKKDSLTQISGGFKYPGFYCPATMEFVNSQMDRLCKSFDNGPHFRNVTNHRFLRRKSQNLRVLDGLQDSRERKNRGELAKSVRKSANFTAYFCDR